MKKQGIKYHKALLYKSYNVGNANNSTPCGSSTYASRRVYFQRINIYATYTDYLGSILVADDISTTNPTDIHRNYDAWGKIRRAEDWGYLTQEDINNEILAEPTEAEAWKWLPRGYTGHEHLLEMDLINMNARPHVRVSVPHICPVVAGLALA